jgi:hypothetical protein
MSQYKRWVAEFEHEGKKFRLQSEPFKDRSGSDSVLEKLKCDALDLRLSTAQLKSLKEISTPKPLTDPAI